MHITNNIAVNWCITPSHTKRLLLVAYNRANIPNKTWILINIATAALNL